MCPERTLKLKASFYGRKTRKEVVSYQDVGIRCFVIANHETPASSLPLHEVLKRVFRDFGFSIHFVEILVEDVCHTTGITCNAYGEAGEAIGIGAFRLDFGRA
jgi:hypothetical protein